MQGCLRGQDKAWQRLPATDPAFCTLRASCIRGTRGNGLFIQLTDSPAADVDIPDEPGSSASALPFGVLIEAQSLGDRQALMNAGRRVIRIDLGEDAQSELERLVDSLATV